MFRSRHSQACLVRGESRNGESELLGYVVSVGAGRVRPGTWRRRGIPCAPQATDAGMNRSLRYFRLHACVFDLEPEYSRLSYTRGVQRKACFREEAAVAPQWIVDELKGRGANRPVELPARRLGSG
jgi:hypothetical protein